MGWKKEVAPGSQEIHKTQWCYRTVWRDKGMEGWQMRCLSSLKVGCLCPSLCSSVLCGSLSGKWKFGGVVVVLVFPPPPSPGCSLGGRHETGPEMSRVTHSTLPRWIGTALCGMRCGESGARRSHWLPGRGTEARPCKGRSGRTKAKLHGSTPIETGKQQLIV